MIQSSSTKNRNVRKRAFDDADFLDDEGPAGTGEVRPKPTVNESGVNARYNNNKTQYEGSRDKEQPPRIQGKIIPIATQASFFGCYLLTSLNPLYLSSYYIGFTTNPRRR